MINFDPTMLTSRLKVLTILMQAHERSCTTFSLAFTGRN